MGGIEARVEDADAHAIPGGSPDELPGGSKLREIIAQMPGELLAGRPVRARGARSTDPTAESEHFARLRRRFVDEPLDEIRLDELHRRPGRWPRGKVVGQIPGVAGGSRRSRRRHEPYGRGRTLRGARPHATRRSDNVRVPGGIPLLACELGRLDIRGDLDQEPGSGYGDHRHVVLLRVFFPVPPDYP